MIEITNEDNMQLMARFEDNHFDLAIVDPPYGIGKDGTLGFATKKTKGFTFNKKEYEQKDWDKETPNQEYFNELFRVSKKQIIWGANYMTDKLPIIKNFIYWHKKGLSDDSKFNEGEMAYLSFGRTRMIDIWWNGFGTINSGEKRTHPTQKPVKLYRWILQEYAKEGYKILDTHLGSGTIAVACHKEKFDLVACEKDTKYYNEAIQRLKLEQMQTSLF